MIILYVIGLIIISIFGTYFAITQLMPNIMERPKRKIKRKTYEFEITNNFEYEGYKDMTRGKSQ